MTHGPSEAAHALRGCKEEVMVSHPGYRLNVILVLEIQLASAAIRARLAPVEVLSHPHPGVPSGLLISFERTRAFSLPRGGARILGSHF